MTPSVPVPTGRSSLTSHNQQLSLDLGMLGRPEGGCGGVGGEPTPLRSPDVSVTTLASLRQLVRREVQLLGRPPPPLPVPPPSQQQQNRQLSPPSAAVGATGGEPKPAPAATSETSPEARSLHELSEHICQWQEAVGGAPSGATPTSGPPSGLPPSGPPRRPPARRRALLAAQSLDQAALMADGRLRRQMSMDHHEPPRPG